MNNRIHVGQPVILNRFDRPTSGMVAVVTKIEDGMVYAQYLSVDRENGEYCETTDEVTPLQDFGVMLRLCEEGYYVEKFSESHAQYKNGDIRPWQQIGGEEIQKVRREIAEGLID